MFETANGEVVLETPDIVGIAIGGFFGALLLFFIFRDIAHVFWFVRYYHVPRADPVKVAAYRKRMEDAYFERDPQDEASTNPFCHLVSDEEFENNLKLFSEAMDARGVSETNSMFGSLEDSYPRLLREALLVAIAPRAVLFQVAHPFVAVGIAQHSNIVRDTPKRFEKTYFHMFRMSFGTRREALASARILRKTHNRVFGRFTKKANAIQQVGAGYSANHTHALMYVAIALAESSIFGYEALVGTFSEADRNNLARDAGYGMMLFGVPQSLTHGTYEDFRIAVEACWQSEILTICDEAKEIAHYLLYPRVWYLKPIFAVARYITRVIMPETFQMQFFGKKANILDQIVVSVMGGIGRFGYRFLPRAVRYVPEYSQAKRRNGETTAPCMMCDPCARYGEAYMRWAKDYFMAVLLPRVNEEVTPRVVVDDDQVKDIESKI